MLATTMRIPLHPEWAYEVKWDGMRVLADVSGESVRLSSRSTADVTVSFPEVSEALSTLGQDILLDGEVVALDDQGTPSFAALASRMHVQNRRRAIDLSNHTPVTYMVFDVLRWNGQSTVELPFSDRHALLSDLSLPNGVNQSTVFDDGAALIAATAEQGLEGVIAKRRASRYQPGVRSADWIKHAHRATTSVVIAGWRQGEGRAAGRVGSIVSAVPGPSGWEYRGTAGSGISDADGAALGRVLAEIEVDRPHLVIPKSDLAALRKEGYRWCEPLLVLDIEHLGYTASGKLRQPVVARIRPDLTADALQYEHELLSQTDDQNNGRTENGGRSQ